MTDQPVREISIQICDWCKTAEQMHPLKVPAWKLEHSVHDDHDRPAGRCKSSALGGSRCDLPAGHGDPDVDSLDVVHGNTSVYTGTRFEWTNRSQRDLYNRSGGSYGT